jgi:hypothetical protein
VRVPLIRTVSLCAGVAAANDTFDGAIAISEVPFSASVDTTEATTDAVDAAANVNCGAPATDASVWYSITTDVEQPILVDMSGSNYSAGAAVVTGTPDAFQLETCGPQAVAFVAQPGVIYSVVVFDDQIDGVGNGGQLELLVDLAPPPPEIHITVNPTASFDPQTGSATLSGTVSCSGRADFAAIEGLLRQVVGRFTVVGFFVQEIGCGGQTEPWSAVVVGDNGKFSGGKAASVTFAFACGIVFCGEDYVERIVKLSRR